MKWINRLYIVFIGILLAMTTGFGVAAFYPEPQAPQYPISKSRPIPESCSKTPEAQQSAECIKLMNQTNEQTQAEQDAFNEKQSIYLNKNAGYTRTAVFLGVLIGALFAMVGLMVIKMSPLVANGFLFGAVLTAVLTRLLISLASLGSNTTGTDGANTLSYLEFFLLVLVTIGVTVVGFKNLVDTSEKGK